MFEEYIDSCIQVLEQVDNKENIFFHFCFNISEYFEDVDTDLITTDVLLARFKDQVARLRDAYKKYEYFQGNSIGLKGFYQRRKSRKNSTGGSTDH